MKHLKRFNEEFKIVNEDISDNDVKKNSKFITIWI